MRLRHSEEEGAETATTFIRPLSVSRSAAHPASWDRCSAQFRSGNVDLRTVRTGEISAIAFWRAVQNVMVHRRNLHGTPWLTLLVKAISPDASASKARVRRRHCSTDVLPENDGNPKLEESRGFGGPPR